MNLPPYVYSKAFWEAISLLVSGLLAVLAHFGVVPTEWAVGSAVVLMVILGILRVFQIEPELRAKALEREVRELKARLK